MAWFYPSTPARFDDLATKGEFFFCAKAAKRRSAMPWGQASGVFRRWLHPEIHGGTGTPGPGNSKGKFHGDWDILMESESINKINWENSITGGRFDSWGSTELSKVQSLI